MAEVPAGFPGTATGDGNAEATTQVLAVAAKCKRVDCLLFSWTCRETSLVGLVASDHNGAVVSGSACELTQMHFTCCTFALIDGEQLDCVCRAAGGGRVVETRRGGTKQTSHRQAKRLPPLHNHQPRAFNMRIPPQSNPMS